MNKEKTVILVTILSLAFSGCTITHKFGPFTGKVVDAETGEPVEGVAVLIGFHTKGSSIGGWVYSFADAVETLTDDRGEFHFPPKRVNLIRFMSFWDKECEISIFKPGYGAYPRHPKSYSVPKLERQRIVPENRYLVYHIPKLLTLTERKKNLRKVVKPGGIPVDKMPILQKLRNEEHFKVFGPNNRSGKISIKEQN